MVKISRRHFINTTGLLTMSATGCLHTRPAGRVLVNDVHSKLNPTYVAGVEKISSLRRLTRTIEAARREGRSVCITGGRHAMGGQQFATDSRMLDLRSLDRVIGFDADKGIVEVEAGIQWPALLKFLLKSQKRHSAPWTFAQKQTGANRFCLGGALASNIHSRGLRMKPFIADIDSFVLVNADGEPRVCSREENRDLFALAVGGYGLFGPIYSLRLRLIRRRKLRRVVEMIFLEQLLPAFNRRIEDAFLYGDFQYAIDPASDDFMRKGIFSCYQPVDEDAFMPARRKLPRQNWRDLVYAAHANPARAFAEYSKYYQETSGQIYWSDLHQFSNYLDDYHLDADRRLGEKQPATEIITEICVPRPGLVRFMEEAREDFRRNRVQVIYGAIRLIERDDESFLAWAREPYACVIFNLHTVHTSEGIGRSAAAFRRLIDMAIRLGGSFYLTYHRFASREQVEACYPQFTEFLRLKWKHDPAEMFQSDWYRHYRALFVDPA